MSTNGSGVASKADILSMDDIKVSDYAVDAWNGKPVRLRELTAKQRETFMRSVAKVMNGNKVEFQDPFGANIILCAMSLTSGDGSRMFPNVDSGVKELGERSADAIDEIAAEVMRISGMTDEEAMTIEGESEETTTGASA